MRDQVAGDAVLYFRPGAASMVAHATLIETGMAFRLVRAHDDPDAPPTAALAALNPQGRVPTLVIGGEVMTESSAICMHLADLAPQAALAPPPGTPARAQWYRWHAVLTNTVQTAFLRSLYPHRYVVDPACRESVRTAADDELSEWRTRLAAELAGRPYLVGGACTTADLFLCMLTRWTRHRRDPFWDEPVLAAHFRSVADRPSYRRVWEVEGLDRDGEPGDR